MFAKVPLYILSIPWLYINVVVKASAFVDVAEFFLLLGFFSLQIGDSFPEV